MRVHAFRQLGLLRGTAAASRHGARLARGTVRRAWLTRRPIDVTPEAVTAALGGHEAKTALAAAGEALPSVTRALAWADQADAAGRARLIAVAERILAHEFDLLGSGPVDLGPAIDWHCDFKSGRRWPLVHRSRIVVSYPDDSDIKVPWELSRFQHLPVLALAHRMTQDRRYLDELGAQLQAWTAANPVEFGVNWQCTMDVAIRAANWTATLVICANAPETRPWLDEALAGLLLHARFIRANLEYGPARGNHYLSDVVGLLITAALFQASDEGQKWIRWAIRELGNEVKHQIRTDGCDHEASVSYHRLVTELFVVGVDAADALAPEALDPAVRPVLARMLQFVADYTRPDGLAPQIGDADNGRLLPLEDYGSVDQRSHVHLFRQAGVKPPIVDGSAAYPAGGFFILRSADLYAAARCGDVGIYGRGCHAHNDLLAFELCWRSVPMVVDPGSYLYTADPVARNTFRSTAVHSTLQLDELEQNGIPPGRLFAMSDRAQAELLDWRPGATPLLRGRHRGYSSAGDRCIHTRTLELSGADSRLDISDEIVTDAAHRLTWRFPLAPCAVEIDQGTVRARFPGVSLVISGAGCEPSIEPGYVSPAYGVRLLAPVATLRGHCEPGRFNTKISLSVAVD